MHPVFTTILLVTAFPWSSNQESRNGICRRQSQFSDKLMTTNLIERHEDVVSVTTCAVVCYSDTNCGSFFYSRIEKFCQLHSVLFITPTDAIVHNGTWYYKVSQAWCPDRDGFILNRSPVLCYKVHSEMQEYAQAKVACSVDGATLLKVKNEDISIHMFEFLRASSGVRSTHFLIGADDNEVAGQYKWVDGEVATWTNWATGEPSHASERCLAMAWFYYFQWNDIPCNNPMNFICQIDSP